MDIKKLIADRYKTPGMISEYGMELMECADGRAVVRMPVDTKCMNPFGGVHGGCLFALADTTAGSAAMTRGKYVTTLSSSVDYLNPGKDTSYIEATATEIRNGNTISIYDVIIRDDKGVELVKITARFFKYAVIEEN